MVVLPAVSKAAPPVQPADVRLGDTPATNASIAAYLSAGERMQSLMDVTWKLCAGLFLLVLAAWLMGLLPAAVSVF